MAIPISIVGTFLVMNELGRTINVISLAGLAFAAGMVVDNAIVVLENIYRHRQMGKSRRNAAFQGAREVWGAVLASTLTTIAVFVPVVFIEGEVGQLFGDIAIAISAAVGFSLLVSITVIPSLSARVLGGSSSNSSFKRLWGGTVLAERFNRGVTNSVGRIVESRGLRVGVIAGLTGLALVLSALLMPKTEYLPLGNQNFLFGILLPPPGYNLDEISSNNDLFVETMSPLWKADPTSDEAKEAPGGGIRNFFYVGLPSLAFLGASANDPLRVRELIPPLQAMNAQLPGTFFIINQSSIFSRGIGEGRSINIDFTGPDLNRLIGLGGETLGKVAEALPGSQARPIPSLDLGNPEVRVTTHRQRAAELGISNRELGFAVSALVDGAKASEYQHEGRAIDLRITTESDTPLRTHLLEQLPVATPAGELVTLGSLAKVEVSSGPVTINHRERQRAITIQVTPAAEQALEDAMDVIESDILAPMRDQGRLGGLYQAHLSGSADDLSRTWRSLRWNFLLALVITYLLMAALFENFVYPFVIMFSVPLAALGGFLGLAIMNLGDAFQPLDVLTMLGFIILVGTVVNNAILIVHQSLHHMRSDGMESHAAIKEAVSNRIRPIFMSVSTSVFGMLPLVLYPGAGSELYRGLGSVVVGGLVVSTVFTLFLVPALLSLMLDLREVLARSFRRRADDDPVAESS